jgi:hypothetical protein
VAADFEWAAKKEKTGQPFHEARLFIVCPGYVWTPLDREPDQPGVRNRLEQLRATSAH